ncbi:hypothetical protein BDA99DRAFT_529305 [Phascolomyces articulosus]|uniref:Uncharacterized protein n=1 Tax=Phascolomyces articulosus TaxID=60185 RepID=A0AAD5JKZ9_9FUNG|nr:hypothetical protein BDA99DRAFT_529305 [Phascolomyces articulosus]
MRSFITTSLLLVFLSMLNAITLATHFMAPTQFEQWETGTKVKIYLKGGNSTSADLKLVDTGGFLLKNLGYIAKDFDYKDEQVFEFLVWDELPPGNTYQLAFHPRLNSGMAATAFSHVFTIVNNKHKKVMSQGEDTKGHDEGYYFISEAM